MKYIPILYSTLMVQALLAGRKTMTRRVIKPQPTPEYFKIGGEWPQHQVVCSFEDAQMTILRHPKTERAVDINDAKSIYGGKGCPYGKVGDVLWVRERFIPNADFMSRKEHPFLFYTDVKPEYVKAKLWKWKPSIFMPKEACRIFLKITDIRVERLQDISEEDAIAEGVEKLYKDTSASGLPYYKEYAKDGGAFTSAYRSFCSLWESINGKDSWHANPWIWVIKFEQIDKPEEFK